MPPHLGRRLKMVHGYILTLKAGNKTDRYLRLAELTDAE
jgi:hypothetical protein